MNQNVSARQVAARIVPRPQSLVDDFHRLQPAALLAVAVADGIDVRIDGADQGRLLSVAHDPVDDAEQDPGEDQEQGCEQRRRAKALGL